MCEMSIVLWEQAPKLLPVGRFPVKLCCNKHRELGKLARSCGLVAGWNWLHMPPEMRDFSLEVDARADILICSVTHLGPRVFP